MDVGIRELKQHLSEYLERAAAGETIRVTDRGQPKAILGPVPGVGRIAAGIAEGWIRSAEESEPAPVPRAKALRSVADVIREDRDGFDRLRPLAR
jgi:prevent-host-death family protein